MGNLVSTLLAVTRHPMYAAHVPWGIAQALLLPNLIAGPLALILIFAVIALRVPREERAMTEEFGDAYRQYMERTGRIVPNRMVAREAS